MKKIILPAVLLSVFAVSQASTAKEREFAAIYTECGLGAMIAPNHEGVAAVTNVTWDLGTTAISSNISSPESCAGGKKKTAAFIHDAYDQIVKDIASGNGTYLNTLLSLSGCQAVSRPAVAGALRNDLSRVVAAPGYSGQSRYEQAKDLYELVNDRIEADFSASCRTIG